MINRRGLLFAVGSASICSPLKILGADPSRLLTHGLVPHNAEPRLNDLVRSWITPNDLFYVRSHAPVPEIDSGSFELSVEGLVNRPFKIRLAGLKEIFTKKVATATLTCAGNRRIEHSRVKKVGGVPWQAGAIGNATWGGCSLSDLLRKAEVMTEAKYVSFESVDQIKRPTGVIPFGASIPIEKAMDNLTSMPGALVVYEMNGQPLPADHGFPIRTVVPGYIGARSVKWLGKIIVSDKPSANHYVATAYKLVTESTADQWAAASPIQRFVVNSVTCLPASGVELKIGPLDVSGYALPPGDPSRTIQMVEVSSDGGGSWVKAKFTSPARPFCWRLWKTTVQLTRQTEALLVRATDSVGQRQPESVDWNLKGYLFNAWHRTLITIRS
jgi:sulfite oxidase